jgi:hypothetical protein
VPKLLTRLRIDEVSAVDRGAGDGVKILLMKRDASKRKDKPMSKFMEFFTGKRSSEHLRKSTAALAESIGSIVGDLDEDKRKALADTFTEFDDHVQKNVTADPARDTTETTMIKELAKALGLKDDASEADVTKAIKDNLVKAAETAAQIEILKAGFSDAEKVYHDKLAEGERPAFRKLNHPEREKLMHKQDDLPEHVRKQLAEAEEMKKRLAKLEEQQELAKFEKIATEYEYPTSRAAELMKLEKADPVAFKGIIEHNKAGWAAAQKAGVFREVGSTGGNGVSDKAYDEFLAKAAEYRKLHPELSEAQAFDKVYTDPANVTLAKRERMESAAPVMNPPGTMR